MAKGALASLPKEKPTIRLDESDFPGIKDLKIDDECTLEVKVKLQHLGRHEYMDNDKQIWGTFQVQSVKVDGETDPLRKGMDQASYGSSANKRK